MLHCLCCGRQCLLRFCIVWMKIPKNEIGPRDIVTSLQLMSLLPLEILRVQPSAVAWSFKILYCWDEKPKNEIVPSPHIMSLLPLKITSAAQRCRSLLSSDPRTVVHLSFKIIQLLECPIYPRCLRHKKYGPLLPSVYFFEKCLTVWKTK